MQALSPLSVASHVLIYTQPYMENYYYHPHFIDVGTEKRDSHPGLNRGGRGCRAQRYHLLHLLWGKGSWMSSGEALLLS